MTAAGSKYQSHEEPIADQRPMKTSTTTRVASIQLNESSMGSSPTLSASGEGA